MLRRCHSWLVDEANDLVVRRRYRWAAVAGSSNTPSLCGWRQRLTSVATRCLWASAREDQSTVQVCKTLRNRRRLDVRAGPQLSCCVPHRGAGSVRNGRLVARVLDRQRGHRTTRFSRGHCVSRRCCEACWRGLSRKVREVNSRGKPGPAYIGSLAYDKSIEKRHEQERGEHAT